MSTLHLQEPGGEGCFPFRTLSIFLALAWPLPSKASSSFTSLDSRGETRMDYRKGCHRPRSGCCPLANSVRFPTSSLLTPLLSILGLTPPQCPRHIRTRALSSWHWPILPWCSCLRLGAGFTLNLKELYLVSFSNSRHWLPLFFKSLFII